MGLNWHAYGFRWYDPAVGRFPSVDPLAAEMPSWSPFSYAFNNPVLLIDPFGLAPESPDYDYFDIDGNYIGSDNRGNEIRIVTDTDSFDINSEKAALGNSVKIDGISLSENAVGVRGFWYSYFHDCTARQPPSSFS